MNSQEIERAVAGMVLRDVKALAEAVAMGVEARHFAEPFAAAVYQGVIDTWRKNQSIDLVTICQAIGRDKFDEAAALRKAAPLTTNVRPYLQSLLDQNRGTELFQRLADIAKKVQARKPLEPLDPIVDQLGSLLAFSKGSSAALTTSILSASLKRALAKTEERILSAKESKLPGIPTGFPRLDDVTYGFQKGWMYVLGARTGIGKTTMATTMAANAAEAGHKVAIVTVEMSDTDLAEKMLSRASKVPLSSLMLGRLSDDEVDRLHVGAEMLDKLSVFITAVKKPQLDHLALELTRLVKVEGVEFIIVDYLQQFETGEEQTKRMTARDTAKGVSVAIQSLAKTLGVPILVLSQLNREAPEEGAPDLKHIAETDQIARDADVVMFLYRLEDRHFLSVAKQRRGKTGVLKLRSQMDISHFEQAPADGTR